MRSIYDKDRDVLTIRVSDLPSDRDQREEAMTVVHYAGQKVASLTLERARERGFYPAEVRNNTPTGRIWYVLRAISREYNWLAKLATVLLLVAAFISIAMQAYPEFARLCIWQPVCVLPPGFYAAMASDGMLTFLTLMIALGVAVELRLRQYRGGVDEAGYNIGRALAYGYFSNFLLPTMLLARSETQRLGLPPDKAIRLSVVYPANVSALKAFHANVEPQIRDFLKTRDLEGSYPSGAGFLKRRVLVVSRAPGVGDGSDMFFDFPTTLYTLGDYYASWNEWRVSEGRAPDDAGVLDELQQVQVNNFFAELRRLCEDGGGLEVAERFGLDRSALRSLYQQHFRHAEPSVLWEQLRSAASPAA